VLERVLDYVRKRGCWEKHLIVLLTIYAKRLATIIWASLFNFLSLALSGVARLAETP
jgi:hypothetical protein